MTPRIHDILRSVDERETSAAHVTAARELEAVRSDLRTVRVALLSSYTIAPLRPYLTVRAARHGVWADQYIGPFNAVHQELRDPSSGCATFAPDVVFVVQELADVCPPLSADYLGLDRTAVQHHVDSIVSDLVESLRAFREHSTAAVVIHTFGQPQTLSLGTADIASEMSEAETIRRLNAQLIGSARTLPGVYFIDHEQLIASVGRRDWHDDKWWFLAHTPCGPMALKTIAKAQAAMMRALAIGRRKCLVLDLDNVLWGGVLGEAGLEGIELGHTYPGNAFRRFQEYLLQLYRRGVLLAIASKNNEADVNDVFRSHPAMVLKREHFAAARVNWQPKPENLRAIADDLGIGLDALAFFDDAPIERALMQEMLPEVLTIDAPASVIDFVRTVEETAAFEQLSWTADDRRRGDMSRERTARSALAASVSSLDAFLSGLEMTATIRPADTFALPRIVDLIARTNQFNLTTRRYTAPELSVMMSAGEHDVWYLQLADRFGDNGIVGVAIVRRVADSAHIDTCLLSCRVIGRTAETALLAHVAQQARAHGLLHLTGEFIPSGRNRPAADFYSRHGFECIEETPGRSRWTLNLSQHQVAWPSYIQQTQLTVA